MLQFYSNPLSPLSRRVWIALLEKEIPFESIIINLQAKDQFKPEFLALNPFHHVPVVVDDGLRIIESMAIMDYLEAKYLQSPLLPQDPAQLAKVRMAQMVSNNELSGLILPLMTETQDSSKLKQTERKIARILNFFAELLDTDAYFGGATLSTGDIVAGNAIVLLSKLGFEVEQVAIVAQWRDRLMQREVWQHTQPNQQQIEIFKQTVQKLMASRK